MSKYKNMLKESENLQDGRLHIMEEYVIVNKMTDEVKEQLSSRKFFESASNVVLKPRIKAIHAGRTRNNNIYLGDKLKGDFNLKSGAYSFMYPYPKPMLKNHDPDSDATGRITNAQFVKDAISGKEYIIIIPEITDQEAIQKCLDGRYMTVSVGGSTDSAICNICGTDVIKDGFCGHYRGEVYDDTKCGWIFGEIWFDECSWVNIPADQEAAVFDKGEPTPMEAYIEAEGNFYDISEGADINTEAAEVLGLCIKESYEEGGSEDVSKVPKKQDEEVLNPQAPVEEEVEKAPEEEAPQESNDSATKPTEDPVVEEGTEDPEPTEDPTEDPAPQEGTEDSEPTEDGEEDVEKLKEEIDNLKSEVERLTSELANANTERESVVEENTSLITKIHQSMIDTIVEMNTIIDDKFEATEEVLNGFASKTLEALDDTYKSLVSKVKENKQIVISQIKNPGYNLAGEETEEVQEKTKDLDSEKVVYNLLKGKLK